MRNTSITCNSFHESDDPFGMVLVGRNWDVGSGYRYGFNGKENDNETYGNKNMVDFGARVYDARLGKFFTTDFFNNENVWQSPYTYAANNPILMVDVEGNKNMVYIYINEQDVKLSQAERDYLLWAIYVAYAKTLSTNNMVLSLEFVYVDKIIEDKWLDQTDAMLVISDPEALLESYPNGGYRISSYAQGSTPPAELGPSAVYPSTYETASGSLWLDNLAYNSWHEILHYLGNNFNRNQYAGDRNAKLDPKLGGNPAEAGHDLPGVDNAPLDGLMTRARSNRAATIQRGGGMVKYGSDYLFKISTARKMDLQSDYGSSSGFVLPVDNATSKAGAKIIGRVVVDSTRPVSQK